MKISWRPLRSSEKFMPLLADCMVSMNMSCSKPGRNLPDALHPTHCRNKSALPRKIYRRRGGKNIRKAFQRPMNEGIKLLNLIQDVYLNEEITVA